MDQFAVEFIFMKGIEDGKTYFTCYEGKLVSTIPDLTAKSNGLEPDIFNPLVLEDERVKVLEDGMYQVFIIGEVFFESDIDLESGTEQGSYVFDAEEKNIKFIPLAVKPKILSHARRE